MARLLFAVVALDAVTPLPQAARTMSSGSTLKSARGMGQCTTVRLPQRDARTGSSEGTDIVSWLPIGNQLRRSLDNGQDYQPPAGLSMRQYIKLGRRRNTEARCSDSYPQAIYVDWGVGTTVILHCPWASPTAPSGSQRPARRYRQPRDAENGPSREDSCPLPAGAKPPNSRCCTLITSRFGFGDAAAILVMKSS